MSDTTSRIERYQLRGGNNALASGACQYHENLGRLWSIARK
jgi:hypothetical protein